MSDNYDEVWGEIQKLDLRKVFIKLTLSSEEGGYAWPESETTNAIEGYRRFLLEAFKAKGDLELKNAPKDEHVPMAIIDIVWHTHILFTRDYKKMCDDVLGFFLHHEHTDIEKYL